MYGSGKSVIIMTMQKVTDGLKNFLHNNRACNTYIIYYTYTHTLRIRTMYIAF